MTSADHVPDSAHGGRNSASIFNASRRTCRRRPASDRRWACPNFSSISSTAARTSANRPACDTGGSTPLSSRRRARCLRWRSPSSTRASATCALRRTFSCLARRRRRHSLPHVRWVFAADASGTYHARHSQQRRRPFLPSLCVIHRRWHLTQRRRESRCPLRRGGSPHRRNVALKLAAAKAMIDAHVSVHVEKAECGAAHRHTPLAERAAELAGTAQ